MSFIKKFVLACMAISLILLGGAGTQSSVMMLQGGGFIGLVVGLIVLYIFFRMAKRAMGCFPSLMIFLGILGFVLYAVGGLNHGVGGISEAVKSFLGQSTPNQSPPSKQIYSQDTDDFYIDENLSSENDYVDYDQSYEYPQEALPQKQYQEPEPPATPQPKKAPSFSDFAEVISGDTLKIRGRYFRLFGIDAPELRQTCADIRGRSYNCGTRAKDWLRGWIEGYPIDCVVLQQSANGVLLGTCSLGEYDLGAAIVNAGWAVAYRAQTDIYVPYEKEAKSKKQGLWRGQFYMPWDWREIQARKPIVKPKKKGLFK